MEEANKVGQPYHKLPITYLMILCHAVVFRGKGICCWSRGSRPGGRVPRFSEWYGLITK